MHAVLSVSLPNLPPLDLNAQTISQFSQRKLKVGLDALTLSHLKQEQDTRLQAILIARSQPFANGWLLTPPLKWLGHDFDKAAFRCLLIHHFGIPFLNPPRVCPTPGCAFAQDVYGDHAITCPHSGQRIGKHNLLVSVVGAALKAVHVPHSFEERVLHNGTHHVLGDIFLPSWELNRDMYIDVTVTNPLCPSNLAQASRECGYAAQKAFLLKKVRYQEVVNANQLWFLPLAVESLGGWHPQAIPFFKSIARRLAQQKAIEISAAMRDLMTSLSVCLQKMNGRMMAERCLS